MNFYMLLMVLCIYLRPTVVMSATKFLSESNVQLLMSVSVHTRISLDFHKETLSPQEVFQSALAREIESRNCDQDVTFLKFISNLLLWRQVKL